MECSIIEILLRIMVVSFIFFLDNESNAFNNLGLLFDFL